jgi:hypothetical protein
MTTLEFVYFICDEFEEPCSEGIEFAKNNSNLLEAIDKLLGTDDDQFICWACWQDKVIGWTDYNKIVDDVISTCTLDGLHQKCAEILKKFIRDNNLS